MKRHIFSLVAATLVAASAAHAQTAEYPKAKHRGPDGGAIMQGTEHERMMAELHLTDEQKAQLKAIHEKYAAERHAARTEEHSEAKAHMSRMGEMSAEQLSEVRAVLTSDQQAKFDAMMAEHKKKHEMREQGKMKHGMGPKPESSL